jgi:uncharacterized coiled-coil protein SlyX
MQQGNMTINTTWNNALNFFGYVNNDDIYTSNGELIGVNLKKYKEVEQGLITCKNRLIELGEIKVPKTQEEIIQEQSEMLEKQGKALNLMMENFQQLQERLNEYTINSINSGNATREHTEQCERSDKQDVSNPRPLQDKDTGGCDKSNTVPKKSRATA